MVCFMCSIMIQIGTKLFEVVWVSKVLLIELCQDCAIIFIKFSSNFYRVQRLNLRHQKQISSILLRHGGNYKLYHFLHQHNVTIKKNLVQSDLLKQYADIIQCENDYQTIDMQEEEKLQQNEQMDSKGLNLFQEKMSELSKLEVWQQIQRLKISLENEFKSKRLFGYFFRN